MSEKLLDRLCPSCLREAVLWLDEHREQIKEVGRILLAVKKVSAALDQFLAAAEEALAKKEVAAEW